MFAFIIFFEISNICANRHTVVFRISQNSNLFTSFGRFFLKLKSQSANSSTGVESDQLIYYSTVSTGSNRLDPTPALVRLVLFRVLLFLGLSTVYFIGQNVGKGQVLLFPIFSDLFFNVILHSIILRFFRRDFFLWF